MKSPYSQHPSLPRGRPTVLLVGLLAAAALPAAGQFSTARAVAPSGLDAWTAAGGSPETSSYVHDDGVSENAVGLTAGGTTAWLHRFDAVGGADVITQLSAAYGTAMAPGSGMPVGAPYTVGLWEDTDDDGDPTTGLVLLASAGGTMAVPDTDTFEPVAIAPTAVSGVFFAGSWVDHAGQQYPGAMDYQISNGRAWLSGSLTVGGFNPNDLNDPNHVGVWEMGDLGFPAVFLMRAEGHGPPAGFCTAKTGMTCGPSTITSTGTPSATQASGFVVTASPARPCRQGILLYNRFTAAPVPFQGGTLCVDAMGLRRAGPTNSMGTSGPNCDGAFAIDMNAFAQAAWIVPDCLGAPSGLPPNNTAAYLKTIGTTVYTQYWGRDSIVTGSYVSGGLSYVVGP